MSKYLPQDEKFTDAWGYLPHSQILITSFINKAMEIFDRNFDTSVSLICLTKAEPTKCCCQSDIYKTSDFSQLFSLADELYKTDPDKNMIHSHPKAHRQMLEGRSNKCFREAVKRICETKHIKEDNEFFVFGPTSTESFEVYIIFTVKKETINKFFRFSNNEFSIFNFSPSLFYATINTLGNVICSTKIYDDYPISLDHDIYYIHQKAAKNFMSRFMMLNQYVDGRVIYDVINKISSLTYEKKQSRASIIFASRANKYLNFLIQFDTPHPLNDYSKTRKLLELASQGNSLITDGLSIFGIGKIADDYDGNDESVLTVDILGHFTWELKCGDKFLFKSSYEKISAKKIDLDRNKLFDSIKRIFSIFDQTVLNNYFEIILRCIQDNHGAIVIFSKNAKEESERLVKNSIKVSTFNVSKSNISYLTKIDGAVLLDETCRCYSFGVILDGAAVDIADMSRGARYNSSLRYFTQASAHTQLIIAVISDDGNVDIFPDLKPLISKDYIQNIVNNIVKMGENEDVLSEAFHKLILQISNLKFYLTEDMCEVINPILIKSNEAKAKEAEGRCVVYFPWEQFEIHPEMNDSYYAENNYPSIDETVRNYIHSF